MSVMNYVPCKSLHLFYFLLQIMLLYCYYCCFVVIAIIYHISVVLPIVLFFFICIEWLISFPLVHSFLIFLFLFLLFPKTFLFLIKLSSIISICRSYNYSYKNVLAELFLQLPSNEGLEGACPLLKIFSSQSCEKDAN